ncbi:MAG: hypothetical protein WCF81_04620 [Roseiarcus sp.]
MNLFIVTLAAMSMARGLAFIIRNGQTTFGFDDAFASIGGGLWTIPGIGRAPIARHFLGRPRHRRFRFEEDRVRE